MAVPFPASGEYVKFVVASYISPQIGEVTCGFRVTGVAGTGASLQEMGDFVLAAVQTAWPACNTPQVTLSGVLAYLLDTVTGRAKQATISPDHVTVGTTAAGLCPKQAAVVGKKITGLAGRGQRGRVFWPFIPKALVDNSGELTAGGVAAYISLMSTFVSPGVVIGGTGNSTLLPVVLHRLLPLTHTDITAAGVSGKIGQQHRRGDYGQPNANI